MVARVGASDLVPASGHRGLPSPGAAHGLCSRPDCDRRASPRASDWGAASWPRDDRRGARLSPSGNSRRGWREPHGSGAYLAGYVVSDASHGARRAGRRVDAQGHIAHGVILVRLRLSSPRWRQRWLLGRRTLASRRLVGGDSRMRLQGNRTDIPRSVSHRRRRRRDANSSLGARWYTSAKPSHRSSKHARRSRAAWISRARPASVAASMPPPGRPSRAPRAPPDTSCRAAGW